MSFNTKDDFGDKIDKLTVMSKLVAKDSQKGDPLSNRYIKVGDKIGLMIKEDIKPGQMIETRVMVQTVIQDKIIEVIHLEEISWGAADRIVEKNTEVKGMVTATEIGIDQGGEPLQEIIGEIETLAMIGLGQGPRANTNRDRIRCYMCREYNHFARDCPNSREESDLQQLQHMVNMEEQGHRSPSMHS